MYGPFDSEIIRNRARQVIEEIDQERRESVDHAKESPDRGTPHDGVLRQIHETFADTERATERRAAEIALAAASECKGRDLFIDADAVHALFVAGISR